MLFRHSSDNFIPKSAMPQNIALKYCRLDDARLSPYPFVFCVIYGYCMTFGETESNAFSETMSLVPECLWYNKHLNLNVQVTDGY